MEHVFLLYVFLGIGEQKKMDSADMYFRNLNDCIYFEEKISKQGNTITSYCLPKIIPQNAVKIY